MVSNNLAYFVFKNLWRGIWQWRVY